MLGWGGVLPREVTMSQPLTCLPGPLVQWKQIQARFGAEPMVLYLAGPLRGDGSSAAIQRNQLRMQRMARDIHQLLPQATLVVPHGNFSFLDESGEAGLALRERVLLDCERLLLRCDGLLLCGADLTPGMLREREVAARAGLPILHVGDWLVELGGWVG